MSEEIAVSNAKRRMPLPGMLAIAFYMLLMAGETILGVAQRVYPWLFLVVAAMLLAGSLGLLRLFRWAWALGMGACFLMMIYNVWFCFAAHHYPSLSFAALNLIFFLYLARPEVRELLR